MNRSRTLDDITSEMCLLTVKAFEQPNKALDRRFRELEREQAKKVAEVVDLAKQWPEIDGIKF